MLAEPFTLLDADRVVDHPDTPAAYVELRELLPLTGAEDRAHLGNLLDWSLADARRPLGASRAFFKRALAGTGDDLLDDWMAALADTPAEDFLDHHVPFLRNLHHMQGHGDREAVVRIFLEVYRAPTAAGRSLPRLERPAADSVILEITRSCNFACVMCSSRTGGFRSEFTMPLQVFGELVRTLSPGATSLRVNGYG
jgi:hypothetical protein